MIKHYKKLTPPAPHVPSNKNSTFYVFNMYKDNMDYTCLCGVVYILVSHGYNKTWDLIQEFPKKMMKCLDVPLHHFLILSFTSVSSVGPSCFKSNQN